MPVDTSALMNCSYGSAGFMLDSYKYTESQATQAGIGRMTTLVRITGKGFIDASGSGAAAAFTAKLAAVAAAMRDAGNNFSITGLGGQTEVSLLAATCLEGGPFVNFTINDGAGPLHKIVEFEVFSNVNKIDNAFNYFAKSAVSPDGLLTQTWTGQINYLGSNALFLVKLNLFRALYAPPNWVVNYSYDVSTDSGGSQTRFTLSAKQCARPMPAGGGSTAVEGEQTVRVEVDEQHKKVTTSDFDFLIVGDPVAFHNYLRQQTVSDPTTIFRESMSISYIKGIRVKSSFTVITGADGNPLISWRQRFAVKYDQQQYEPILFPGAAPVLVLKPQTFGQITQSGEAVGAGVWISAPDAAGQYLLDLPDIDYEDSDTVEKRTTWTYVFTGQDPTNMSFVVAQLSSLSRPDDPGEADDTEG